MTAMAGPRKTVSIHDYPEHLNPFRDEDNHNKIRFWTLGRKLSRSNSISFSGIKELKNSWALRSFMRKGKKADFSSKDGKPSVQVNGQETSPIVFRRAMQYSSACSGVRSTVGSPERTDRYVYGGSVTPLPRSRFQERLRASHQDVESISNTPRMARSDILGSRLSVGSTNPFDEHPIPPVRASRRKKKRAPPPPPESSSPDATINKENFDLRITEKEDKSSSNLNLDDEIENLNLNIELKIVEDKDNTSPCIVQNNETAAEKDPDKKPEAIEILNSSSEVNNITEHLANIPDNNDTKSDSDENVSDNSFPKINIEKYRRNSSVDDDDIKLRRGNLEDFHSLSNKRSKSLINTTDERYVAFDSNENKSFDINSNEEPKKVICKLYDETRKKSIDNSTSSTEKELLEVERATRELEKEISKLNSALNEDDGLLLDGTRMSFNEIRKKFDTNDSTSPNPIPKPRRSHCGEPPINGNVSI